MNEDSAFEFLTKLSSQFTASNIKQIEKVVVSVTKKQAPTPTVPAVHPTKKRTQPTASAAASLAPTNVVKKRIIETPQPISQIKQPTPRMISVPDVSKQTSMDFNKYNILEAIVMNTPIEDRMDNQGYIDRSALCFKYFENKIAQSTTSKKNALEEECIVENVHIVPEVMRMLINECSKYDGGDDNDNDNNNSNNNDVHNIDSKLVSGEQLKLLSNIELCSYEYETSEMREPKKDERPCVYGDLCCVKKRFKWIMKSYVLPSERRELMKNNKQDVEANPCVCCAREDVNSQTTYIAIGDAKCENRVVSQRYRNSVEPGQFSYNSVLCSGASMFVCAKNRWNKLHERIIDGLRYLVQDQTYYQHPKSSAELQSGVTNPLMLTSSAKAPLMIMPWAVGGGTKAAAASNEGNETAGCDDGQNF